MLAPALLCQQLLVTTCTTALYQPVLPQWAAGDVIGCCIDLDAGSMRFYRNGKDLVSAACCQ